METLLDSYRDMIATLDATVASLVEEYQSDMACKLGCSGCCIDGFKIRYVEALSVLKGFCDLPPNMAQIVLERLDNPTEETSSEAYREVTQPQRDLIARTPATQLAGKPITPCPLLNTAGACSIYEDRPALCRAFGLILKANKTLGCCSLNFQDREDPTGLKALDLAPYYQLLDHLSQRLWDAHPLSADTEPPRLSIRTYLKALLQGAISSPEPLPEVTAPMRPPARPVSAPA